MNFETIFGHFRTGLRFGFDLRTDVFGFYGVFWYHSNSVTNREGTKRCPVYMGLRFGSFCVIVGKINNMFLCVKKSCLYIFSCHINIEIVMNGNYM